MVNFINKYKNLGRMTFGLLISIPLPLASFASDAGSVATRTFESESCGQNCLYARANENIALQVFYIRNELTRLKELVNSNSKTKDEKMAELRKVTYCAAKGSTPESCYQAYETMRLLQLYKANHASLSHSDMREKLSNQSGKNIIAPATQDEEITFTYVPTLKDLDKVYDTILKTSGRELAGPAIQEIYEKMPKEPSPDDFVVFEKKPRPDGTTADVIAMNADGTVKKDTKKYQAALADYQNRKKDYENEIGLVINDTGKKVTLKSDLKTQQSESTKQFRSARTPIVDTANKNTRTATQDITAPSTPQKTIDTGVDPIVQRPSENNVSHALQLAPEVIDNLTTQLIKSAEPKKNSR